MAVSFASFTDEELATVSQIVDRAVEAGIYTDRIECEMDIAATHATNQLRLDDLLGANQFNFMHDMRGIQRHLNRKTGKLSNFFQPRFSR